MMEILSINERVEKVKNDREEVSRFIEEYKPFIASVVKSSTGRYMRYGEDDELSIALIAFAEAINSYNIKAGNFLPFAKNVIKRRLIDYYRKESKLNNIISLTNYSEGDELNEYDFSVDESISQYSSEQENNDRKLEIEDLKADLKTWDITFDDLVRSSPKHARTRTLYKDIVRFLLANQELVDSIRQRRCLPTSEIEKRMSIPRKKIERGRRYILASLIIAMGDYQYLREFLELENGAEVKN